MFIRLDHVPTYERHLLFWSDLDERQEPEGAMPSIAWPLSNANLAVRPDAGISSLAKPVGLCVERRLN